MKKTMTRILTLALALAMSASVLAGCSDSPEPAASGSSTESTASEDAAGGERAKLTAMIVKWSPLTKDVNEMQWLKNVAEAANVEVEWQQESSDWNDKKNAVFSSGNIPDVLFSAAGDAEFTQYPGLFEDMGPLIDQYAPNVKEMFETGNRIRLQGYGREDLYPSQNRRYLRGLQELCLYVYQQNLAG